LEKAYVAGQIEDEREMRATLATFGITDPVDTGFLLASLDVLREWGVSAPTMSERVAAENEPASQKQLDYITTLCGEKGQPFPDTSLTKATASQVIKQLQAGTYDADSWRVLF
jgi:hypothetical protein